MADNAINCIKYPTIRFRLLFPSVTSSEKSPANPLITQKILPRSISLIIAL
jgi:hypothetical protein